MNSSNTASVILELVRPLSTFTVGMTDIIDHTFGTLDVGDAEALAIVALIGAPSMSTADLRGCSGLSRRAHDLLVHQLIDHGLVRRAPSPRDRRLRLVTLTRRGRRRADELERRLLDYFRESGELVGDILRMLGEPSDKAVPRAQVDLAPLDVVVHMSRLGHTLDAAILEQGAPKHPKNRDQLALLLIAAGPPARPSNLADALTLTAGGLTRVLDQLESDRLVVREYGRMETDRRAVVVDLTSDGRQVVAAIAAGLASIKPELRSLFTGLAEYTSSDVAAT